MDKAAGVYGAEKEQFAKAVTAERKEWRDKIRELTKNVSLLVHSPGLEQTKKIDLEIIYTEFSIRLNPGDEHDKKLLECLRKTIDSSDTQQQKNFKEFQNEVIWLLKEDWERVKKETEPIWKLGFLSFTKKTVDRKTKQISKKTDILNVINGVLFYFPKVIFIGLSSICIFSFFRLIYFLLQK